jgi:hypothetical protein
MMLSRAIYISIAYLHCHSVHLTERPSELTKLLARHSCARLDHALRRLDRKRVELRRFIEVKVPKIAVSGLDGLENSHATSIPIRWRG